LDLLTLTGLGANYTRNQAKELWNDRFITDEEKFKYYGISLEILYEFDFQLLFPYSIVF
jgi:hypothetical protein